jgi:hypothetical protein
VTISEKHRLRISESRVLRIILGYNKELHNLNSSSDMIRMIKPRRVLWAGHVACTETRLSPSRVFCGKARMKEASRNTLI